MTEHIVRMVGKALEEGGTVLPELEINCTTAVDEDGLTPVVIVTVGRDLGTSNKDSRTVVVPKGDFVEAVDHFKRIPPG